MVLTSGGTTKRLLVPRFDIDMTECMFCNLCVYPCPEDCIFMTGGPNSEKQPLDYEYSQYDRKKLIFEFATLTKKEIKKLTDPPKQQEICMINIVFWFFVAMTVISAFFVVLSKNLYMLLFHY